MAAETALANKEQKVAPTREGLKEGPVLSPVDPLQPPPTDSPLSAPLKALQHQQLLDQIRDQTWSSVIHVLTKVVASAAPEDRRRVEELEQHLATLLGEKKKRKSFDGRDTVFFEWLVAILGENAAESVVVKIDKTISENGVALQNDPAAVGKLVAELATLLSLGDTLLKLGVSPQAVEKELKEAFRSKFQPVNQVDVREVRSVPQPAAGPLVQPPPIVLVRDLAGAKAHPDAVEKFLSTPNGGVALRNLLEAKPSPQERVTFLANLKDAVGPERFSRILAAYDQQLGVPIAIDLIRLREGNPVAQAETVRLCFGPTSTIFTPQERERFVSFIKREQASVLEVIARENERFVPSITALEQKRFERLGQLAKELNGESIPNVPHEKAREEALRAIAQRFPGLSGKSEEDVLKALHRLAGTDKDNWSDFQGRLPEVGIKPIQPDDPKAQNAQMREIKRLAALLESHVSDVIECDKELARLRAIQSNGQYDEAAQVSASYDKLLGGLFPEYGADRFRNMRAETRIYLDTLAARIESAKPSERAALVAERDSLEWRALQARTGMHLSKTPPEVQRSMALVQEYLLAHDQGSPRSEVFTKAAQNIVQGLQAVQEYAEEQRKILAKGYEIKTKQLHDLEDAVKKCNDVLNKEREVNGSDYWNSVYTEIGKLKAWKENGVTQVTYDDGKSWTPIDEAINAHWKEINAKYTRLNMGTEGHQTRMIENASRLAHWEHERDKAVAQKKELEECLQKRILDSQQSLIRQIVHSGGTIEGAIDPASFKSIVSRCAVQSSTETIDAKYKTLLAHRESVQRSFTNPIMRTHSALFDQAENRGVSSALSEPAQGATQFKTQAELVARLNDIIVNDPSARPSKEALDVLRASLDKDSPLAKQLALVASAPSNEILMQRLYARLSMDDAARVSLFLLTYKRPSLFNTFFEGTGHTPPSNAAEVWKHLASSQSEDLGPLLTLIPSLQKQAEIEELAAKLPDADLANLKGEFKRATGRSLGDSLISLLPAEGGARSRYLYYQIAGSRCVDSADLARFFPQGIVPEGIRERKEKLAEILDADSSSPLYSLLQGLRSGNVNKVENDQSQRLKALLEAQADARAPLQAALPVFVQLGRFDRADEIRAKLESLDKQFDTELKAILGSAEASVLTRMGIEGQIRSMRTALSGLKAAQLSDPAGAVARKAFEVMQILENPKMPVSAALQELRRAEFSPEQMLVFETSYAQHVVQRAPTGLTGDLSKDLSAKEGAPGQEQLKHLLKGGNGLTEYDLIQLTEGILDPKKAQLTVRAMIAIEAKKHLPEVIEDAIKAGRFTRQQWEEFRKSEFAKDAAEYYKAATESDAAKKASATATKTAIMMRDGLDAGVNGISWTVGKIGSLTKEQISEADAYYRKRYGTGIADDLKKNMSTIEGAWERILSGTPAERATGVMQVAIGRLEDAATKGADLRVVRQALDLCSTPDQRRELIKNLDTWVQGLPNSLIYVDGRGPSVIEYVRQHGGPFGESDALFLKQALTSDNPSALTGAKLDQYIMLREQLVFQLARADQLRVARDEIHQQARDFFTNVGNAWSKSILDRDNRTISWDRADAVVRANTRMRYNQSDLLARQQMGFTDIRETKELMRVRGEMILEDLVKGQDRGLSVEQGDRNFRELRERDAKVEWKVARKEKVEAWAREAEIAQKRLENFDWWTNVIYTGVKTVAIIAACVAFTPAGALAFATAWNLGEKAFKMAFNGMSWGEATREFLIDLAIDVAFVGVLGCLKFGRGLVKSADGTIKGSKWGFYWTSPFKRAPVGGIGHTKDVLPGKAVDNAPGRGVVKEWVKGDGKRLILGATDKFVKNLGEGVEKSFQYSLKGIGANGPSQGLAEAFRQWAHAAAKKENDDKKTDPLLKADDRGTQSSTKEKKEVTDLQLTGKPGGADPVGQGAQGQTQPTQSSEQLPTTPREAQSTQPQDKKERPAPANPQSTATATPPANTPEPNLSQATKDWIAQTLSWNMLGSLVDSILGLFKPSSTPDTPPPPAVNPPPPRVDPPPGSGDGKGPGMGPMLATDSSTGNATGNAYTRAVNQGQPQEAINTTPGSPQLQPNSSFNAYAATQSLRDQQTQLANDAQLAANLATADALVIASRLAQAEARRMAEAAKLAASEAAAVAAATTQRDAARDQRHTNRNADQTVLAHAHLSDSMNTHPRMIGARDVETKEASANIAREATARETAAREISAREISVPLMRSDAKAEKIAADSELFIKTAALKAREEKSVSQAVVAGKVTEEAQQNARVARLTEENNKNTSERAAVLSAERAHEVREQEKMLAVKQEKGGIKANSASIHAMSAQVAQRDLHQEEALSGKNVKASQEERAERPLASQVPRVEQRDPLLTAQRAHETSTISDQDEEALRAEEELIQRKRSDKARKQKLAAARAARERQIIIHQLMTSSFEQSKREKLLRLLISLGISEKEYRELVARLGQAAVEQQATQAEQAEKIAIAPLENTPVKESVPTMKSSAPRQDTSLVVKHQARTRAELYAKLRKQQKETVV